MAVSVGCNRGTESNTPATGSLTPAAATVPANRKYLLERVDEAAVVQLYADGFEKLPLGEKTLIWHLYQAALAGRDIFYDQRYAHNLEMRDVLEEILTHPENVNPETLSEIQRYTKLFWINTGPYNNLTARKFVLNTTPEAFAAAVAAAAKSGAKFPVRAGESLEGMVKRLQPLFFDLTVDPIVTNKTPGAGKDILASSANNLYAGVTMKDLAGFKEQHPLNSRLVKTEREARRRGLSRRRQVRRADPRDRRASRSRDPICDRADGEGAAGAREVLPDRRDRRSRGLRHRMGPGQGLARRYDERVHRGLHGCPRDEGLVGVARLLRES